MPSGFCLISTNVLRNKFDFHVLLSCAPRLGRSISYGVLLGCPPRWGFFFCFFIKCGMDRQAFFCWSGERASGGWCLEMQTRQKEGGRRRTKDGNEEERTGASKQRSKLLSRVALANGGAKPGSRFLSRRRVKKWESRVSFLILKIS